MPFLSDWKYPEITHLFSKYRYFLLSLYVVSLSYWVFLSSLQHPNKNQLKESHSTAGTPENRLLWKLEWGVKQMYFSSQIIQTLPLKCVAGENPYLHGWWMHCHWQSLLHRRLKKKIVLSWPCLTMPSAPAINEENNISEIQLFWAEDTVSLGCCCGIYLTKSEWRSQCSQIHCHRL